jgi:glucose-6-phosphate dehydrogenase assembly protein OpcA
MIELARWEQRGVRMADVLQNLERLRRTGERTATRTSVVNLMAVAADQEICQRVCAAMHALGGRHPGRTVVLVLDDGAGGLDARVELHATSAEGVNVWSEDVVLTVRGGVRRHLDSLAEPLTLPDLPVVAWYVTTGPRPDDRLVDAADVILVDSKEMGDVDAFPEILQLTRRKAVVDLSWIRLTPWRSLFAHLFDGPAYRPFVDDVRTAEVRGKPGPRHLLAGWLALRLDLPRPALHLEDARHASIRVVAQDGPLRAEFVAERRSQERLVRASATVHGGPHHEEVLPLPETSLTWSLAHALSDLESDHVYAEALEGALELAA